MSAKEMRGTPVEETSPGPERWSDVEKSVNLVLSSSLGMQGTLR